MGQLLLIALIITGLHVCCWPGMVLSPLRAVAAGLLDRALGLRVSRYVQKPLWDCLPCMASVWGLLIGWLPVVRYANPYETALYLLALCGLLALISAHLQSPEDGPVAD